MRILIIEDEPKTARYLSKGLTEAGYVVDHAGDGEQGLHLARSESYEIVICDVMLPGMDGLSLIKTLRAEGWSVPTIFLTARDSVEDRVAGLDTGADDYLVKPFSFTELLARIRSQLRRGPARVVEAYRAGDLTVDPLRRTVVRDGASIALTPKEFALLLLLLRRKGEVMTRTVISEQVWDMNFDSDTNVVDVAIRRLRKKIDEPFGVPLIHTVRGVGYVLRDPS